MTGRNIFYALTLSISFAISLQAADRCSAITEIVFHEKLHMCDHSKSPKEQFIDHLKRTGELTDSNEVGIVEPPCIVHEGQFHLDACEQCSASAGMCGCICVLSSLSGMPSPVSLTWNLSGIAVSLACMPLARIIRLFRLQVEIEEKKAN